MSIGWQKWYHGAGQGVDVFPDKATNDRYISATRFLRMLDKLQLLPKNHDGKIWLTWRKRYIERIDMWTWPSPK